MGFSLKLAALAVAPLVAAQNLIMLPGSVDVDATCLDGSPYGVYFSPGSGDGVNKWVIYFQGGGWCYDEADCWGRSQGNLGSSTKWGPTMSAGGLVSTNNATNPLFGNANHLLLPYCDGNSFAGFRSSPLVVNGKPLHMRGHAILTYVMETVLPQNLIKAPNSWGSATDVLLTGCSAGGLATYLHADYVKSVLPNKSVQYHVVPISGFFLDHTTVAGQAVYGTQMEYVFKMQNASAGVNQACLSAYSVDTQWMCNMAPHVYPYITSPIFMLNSKFDSWQSGCVLTSEFVSSNSSTANGNCSAVPGWASCAGNPESCTNAQVSTGYNPFGADYVTAYSASGTSQKPGNGAFIVSCHTHCEGQDDTAWNRFTVGGVTMKDAVVAWLSAPPTDPASAHTYTDCSYNANGTPRQCNPSCTGSFDSSAPAYGYPQA